MAGKKPSLCQKIAASLITNSQAYINGRVIAEVASCDLADAEQSNMKRVWLVLE